MWQLEKQRTENGNSIQLINIEALYIRVKPPLSGQHGGALNLEMRITENMYIVYSHVPNIIM